MVRISVDIQRCIGAAQCVLTASEVFDQDDDGFVSVLNPRPDDSLADTVRLAGRLCPSQTITVHEG